MTQHRRHPHADAAEHVLNLLDELRRGASRAAAKAEIAAQIEFIANLPPLLSAKSIRTAAQKANRAAANLQTALRDLLKVVPQWFPGRDTVQRSGEFVAPLRDVLLKWHTGVKGGDPRRAQPLDLACVLTALRLIDKFSAKPAVSSHRGNLVSIAQVLHQTVTGRPSSAAGMLRMCKEVMRLRKHSPQEQNP
jgi:hypothetical protein